MKTERPTPTPTRRGALKTALAAAAAALLSGRRAAPPPPEKPRRKIRWIGHG